MTKERNLKQALEETLEDLEKEISQVEKVSKGMRIRPNQLLRPNGQSVLTPLIVAKAQILCALVDLKMSEPSVRANEGFTDGFP